MSIKNKKIKIGITGQSGFIGFHLYNTLGLMPDKYERIDFERSYFNEDIQLDKFIKKCDVIVHLAAMNRHEDQQTIYNNNIELVNKIIDSCERTKSKPHILFSSSSQEEKDNLYGKSKKEGRILFENWAKKNKAFFSGLIIPNVFGAFGRPHYNSVVATFCHQLTNNGTPRIDVDGELKLIYVEELVGDIINQINHLKKPVSCVHIPHRYEIKVSSLLKKIENYKSDYLENGIIPSLNTDFEKNLFITFLTYIDHQSFFPVRLKKNTDTRGSFVEIIKLNSGGQVSFSTTLTNITRGNHYHTHKVERFIVIRGKALVELRKINTANVLSYKLDGNEPSFVDMPIWYTHNIKNIGKEDLYTLFWVNEFFNSKDPDTYFEAV